MYTVKISLSNKMFSDYDSLDSNKDVMKISKYFKTIYF